MTTSKLAYEAAFPDGFVTSVNYVVPKELSDIAEKLEALDVEDEDAVAEVRAEIKGIEAGDYTFRFTVEDGCENCPIDEAKEPLPLPLTAAEAQAILYGEYPIEEVFSDLCNEPLGEDFINDLAEKKDFCDEYVNYSCGGSCDELDYYLDAWKYIIDHIVSGQITESRSIHGLNILTSAIIKRKQPSRNGTKLIENGEFTEYFQYTPAIRKLIYTTG